LRHREAAVRLGGVVLTRIWLRLAAIVAAGFLALVACDGIGLAASPTAPAAAPSSTPVPTAAPLELPTATQPEARVTASTPTPAATHLQPGTPVEIRDIQMIDASDGWALGRAGGSGDHVLKTTNGGDTWLDVTPPESPASSFATAVALFADDQTGWVIYLGNRAGSTLIEIRSWRTSDGGETWESGSGFDPIENPEVLPVLFFSDPATGWLLLEHFIGMGHHGSTLLWTQDGGRTWQRLAGAPESESTCHRTGLSFSGSTNGWMTGECPFELGGGVFLEVSEDGGSTWQTLALPPPTQSPDLFQTALSCSTRSPHLFATQAGMLVVTCSMEDASSTQQQNFLYTTSSGGLTWQTSAFPGGELYLLDPSHGWALSKDQYWTEDGGATWTKINTVTWEGQFSFVSAQLGWAVARSQEETALVRTTDGGRTWELMEPIISP
jgi:photosystem II stability/assembly factor-like uncharacterized protein